MRNLARGSLIEEVSAMMREKISSMEVGEKLPTEAELVGQLGVSRQTVREVLSSLQADGLVEVRRGIGSFVADQNAVNRLRFIEWFKGNHFEIEELLEVRLAIEPFLAELTAAKRTEEDVRLLQENLLSFPGILDRNELQEIVATDEGFHQIIADASRNSGLQLFYASFIPSLRTYRSHVFAPPGDRYKALAEHTRIFEAIRAQNPDEANVAMRDHILASRHDVKRIASALGAT